MATDKTQRRQDLLNAARHVFATRGYHDTKVDDVVARAKVAKGTFYLYFRDKRSIFVELVDSLFLQIGAAILRVDTAADVALQVKHNIRAIVTVLLEDPQTTQILMSHAAGLDQEFAEKIGSFYNGVRNQLRESLEEGQQLGIVRLGDAELLATFTIGALKEVLQETIRSEQPRALETIVTELFGLLEHGYLRVPPGESQAETAVETKAAKPAGKGVRRA